MHNTRPVLLSAAFLLPLMVLLLLCAVLQVAPFGPGSLACADADGQYSSYFAFYQDVMLHGEDGLYSFEKVLGGSLAGFFAYYLTSPFNLLFLLFPGEKIPLAFDLMVLLKLSTCALTFALYLDSHKRLRPGSLLFTTAYALCGYNLAYYWCTMWTDAVIFLPLITWGIECLIDRDRPYLYLFSLAGAIFACFYTGYMLCLFSLLYFLYYFLLQKSFRDKLFWPVAGRFAAASLGAAALCAVVLLPGLLALSGGVEVSPTLFVKGYTYPVALRVLSLLLPGRDAAFYDTLVRPTLAVLILLSAGFTALGLYAFLSEHCPKHRRMAIGMVLFAITLIWYFTVEKHVRRFELGLAPNPLLSKLLSGKVSFAEMYNGGANIYIGQLSALFIGTYFFHHGIGDREKRISLLLLTVLVLSLLLYLPNLVWHGFEQNNGFNYRYSFLVCFVLLLLAERGYTAVEGILKERRWVLPLLFTLQVLSLGVTFGMTLSGELPYAVNSEQFAAVYRENRDLYANLSGRDSSFYRIRKEAPIFSYNDPMLFHYRGVVHFSSSEKQRTLDFMKRIGINILDEYWANGDNGASRAADLLLGVQYYQGESFADYEPVDDVFLRNPYALPLAYTTTQDVLYGPAACDDPCKNLNALFAALCPGEPPVFTPMEDATRQNGISSIMIQAAVPSSEPLYLSIPSGRPDQLILRQDGMHVWTPSRPLYAPSALYLGCSEPGKILDLTLRGIMLPDEVQIYQENSKVLASVHARLTEAPVDVERRRESWITASVSTTEDRDVLVFNLPAEDGWIARVDGQIHDTQEALGLFLALKLDPGEHTVELRFTPPGLLAGAYLSGVTLLLCLWRWRRIKKW